MDQHRIRLFAGCGIVAGSEPERELAESNAKLVPMPDPLYGEKGCVFIIARHGMAAPDVKALGAFLVGLGLAKYKCPERVEQIDAYPLTRVGKLDKPALKKRIADQLAAEMDHSSEDRR